MAALILGIGAAIAAGGAMAASAIKAKSAERQADAQKAAVNKYAAALKAMASKKQGGISQAQQRSLKTEGALDRAALGQQALDAARAGGRQATVEERGRIAQAQQESAAAQQRTIDQMSQQQAVTKAAERDALNQQALAASMQAQSIDPKALKQAEIATGVGQATGTIGQTVAGVGMTKLQPQLQMQGNIKAYEQLTGPGFTGTPEDKERIMRMQYPATPGTVGD